MYLPYGVSQDFLVYDKTEIYVGSSLGYHVYPAFGQRCECFLEKPLEVYDILSDDGNLRLVPVDIDIGKS